MRKRIGAIGLAAALLLTLICPALAANGKAEFVVNAPASVKAGETFSVTVELKDNPGFCAIGFTLTFDKEQMTCTNANSGALTKGMLFVGNPSAEYGAKVGGASTDVMTGDGVLGVFKFTAKSDLDSPEFGLAGIQISDVDGNPISYQAEDEVTVDPKPADPKPADPTPTAPAQPDNPGTTEDPNQPEDPGTTEDPNQPEDPGTTEDPTQPEDPGTTTGPELPADLPSFTDTVGHWGAAYIGKAAQMGLFKGYPDGSFGPDQNVTRAQFVTVLYRMAGSPAVSGPAPFTDIADQSQEFQDAIAWSYENGYVNGRSADTFDPNGSITRQEAMKILFGHNGGVSGDEVLVAPIYDATFTDSGEIADWAKPAMYWGVYNQLIAGTSPTTLSPQGNATRAQLAKILVIYAEQFTE